jgi:hypothetical protein
MVSHCLVNLQPVRLQYQLTRSHMLPLTSQMLQQAARAATQRLMDQRVDINEKG